MRIAIVGATGLVGQQFLSLLTSRDYSKLYLLASAKSAGQVMTRHGYCFVIEDAARFDFSQVDFVLFSSADEISAQLAPRAVQQGAIVVDNTSVFRMEENVPLVVPEINGHCLQKKAQIIANPNCCAIPLAMVLQPILSHWGLEYVHAVTYQAVSGAGRQALLGFDAELKQWITTGHLEPQWGQSVPIAMNVYPQIGDVDDWGVTGEEAKIRAETAKILQCSSPMYVTACRVPVRIGHSEVVHCRTERPVTLTELKSSLQRPGITLADTATPLTHAQGEDAVFVSRLRVDQDDPQMVQLWLTSDNLRRGAASNAWSIMQYLRDQP